MSKLTKKQRQELTRALDAIDVTRPGFAGTDHISKALGEPRVSSYLQTWVIPNLTSLLGDEK